MSIFNTKKNYTTIIFDDKYKNFIKNLYTIVENEWFNTPFNPLFNKMHDWIENYVRENVNNINCTGNIVDMPNLFTINICLLLGNEIYKYNSFEEINFKDFRKIYFACNSYNSGFEPSSNTERCACKHKISPSSMFYMHSSFNKIIIQLGMDCIKKTGISGSFFKNLKKKAEAESVYNKKIMTSVFEELKKFFKTREEYKQCIDCKKYTISKKYDSYKTRCISCYKSYKNKNIKREKTDSLYDLNENTYFEIPYENKDNFKALGGRFDSNNKLWYINNRLLNDDVNNVIKKLGCPTVWEEDD
jgi:hypothetical protein